MKILTVFIILMLISLSVYSQELPEPTTLPITYEFQIAWGTKTALVWNNVTAKSLTISAGAVSITHNYYGILGDNKFEFETVNSEVGNLEKGLVVFEILNTPTAKLVNYFRIRVRASIVYDTQTITSAWSDATYWVMILNVRKLNQPISIK